tara:strand:- start:1625 stop:2545 length:921 start_codon:yes stop_codon:yes gene_type:complete
MKSEAQIKLGFVGIGTMGAPMVRCLVKAGYRPMLLDANPDAARTVAQETALSVAASEEDLGRACDMVILMVPTSAIVRHVSMGLGDGKSGLAASLAAGATIVDMSSSDPVETRKLGAVLAGHGIHLLDAPVSGGVRKAIAGTLAIMLGADDEEAVAPVTRVLEAMGTVYRTGPLASGHASKVLNNYVSAAGLAAACEAVIVGQKFGLNPKTLVNVINASTGRNNSTENKLLQFILNGEFSKAGFALDLMAKDVGLAASLSETLELELPGLAEARRLWSEASTKLDRGADHTEIFRYLERAAENDDT